MKGFLDKKGNEETHISRGPMVPWSNLPLRAISPLCNERQQTIEFRVVSSISDIESRPLIDDSWTVLINPFSGTSAESKIRKPLNAFMLFMRDNRQKFCRGSAVKQSSELNKELGKAWHALSKDEQEKYFEMAKQEREEHSKQYVSLRMSSDSATASLQPNWSARDNYAINKKKRKKRERSLGRLFLLASFKLLNSVW